MKCPHCLDSFHESWEIVNSRIDDKEYFFEIRHCICPTCNKAVIQLGKRFKGYNSVFDWNFVYPKAISRSPIPPEVDDENLISDYTESCNVLADSPKSSAALSRRCLQYILREKAKVKHQNLDLEIDEVISSNSLPSDLSENLDYIRNVGNFAAHPIKSKSTGEIMDIEPGEAEWNLDVVEDLIDFYFVRPAKSLKKKESLNNKLREAGKPELN